MLVLVKVAEKLKLLIDEFQEKVPIISCLCNNGLRDRHWEQISGLLGHPFKPTSSTTLETALGLGLDSQASTYCVHKYVDTCRPRARP